MFTVENSSTNSLTKTAKSIHIESAPVPGKMAPSDMSFQIRKLSKEIRKEQRKKLENISVNDSVLGTDSRN